MSLGARRAAPAAIIVACALAAPAAHAADGDDVLVGQIAQVQDLPQISGQPPTPFGTATPTPTPTMEPTPTPSAGPGEEELARTGDDAALKALAGLSLLGLGLSLRRLLPHGAPD